MKKTSFLLKFLILYFLTTLILNIQAEGLLAQSVKNNLDDYNQYKSKIQKTDKNEINDQWDMEVYRNKKYHFLVQFPKGWDYDKGTSETTLARAINRNKGITISIQVIHLGYSPKNPNNIIESLPEELYKNNFIDDLMKLYNTKRESFKLEKGSLNNFPAYIYEFITNQAAGTQSYQYISKQVQCYFDSRLYQLVINLPIILYDEDIEKLFNHVIYSFKFDASYRKID